MSPSDGMFQAISGRILETIRNKAKVTWAVCWLNWSPPSPAQSAVKGTSSHATGLVQLRYLVPIRNLLLLYNGTIANN